MTFNQHRWVPPLCQALFQGLGYHSKQRQMTVPCPGSSLTHSLGDVVQVNQQLRSIVILPQWVNKIWIRSMFEVVSAPKPNLTIKISDYVITCYWQSRCFLSSEYLAGHRSRHRSSEFFILKCSTRLFEYGINPTQGSSFPTDDKQWHQIVQMIRLSSKNKLLWILDPRNF